MKLALVVVMMVSGLAVAAPKRDARPATAAQRAEYKKHMKAGWALQKQQKWAEAVVEFEAALAAVEADQRAFSELGFSAMNAGDFKKARVADEQAVQVASDKKVKAAALYNLGLVFEKTSDRSGALRAYLASLELRPNKVVEQAVGRLGATPSAPPPFCAAGAKPCDCVLQDAFSGGPGPDEGAACEVKKDAPVPGFHVVRVSRPFHSESYEYLLDEHAQLAAVIAGDYEYHWGRYSFHQAADRIENRTVGGHRVLWIEVSDELDETSGDETTMAIDTTRNTLVTLCLPGDGKAPTRCPLRSVPILREQDGATKSKTVLDLAIASDGTATVKLKQGPSDEAINARVGPHKLW
ncbi:MAG TPA: tetratricopeptide repeat protein [Kofleriaceae bacterium]